jgi:hypothetical protein
MEDARDGQICGPTQFTVGKSEETKPHERRIYIWDLKEMATWAR